MPSVNIYEAKTTLSKLIARVEDGEEITISRNGRPVAILTSVKKQVAPRTPGGLAGRIRIADDFDSFTEEDAAEWYAS